MKVLKIIVITFFVLVICKTEAQRDSTKYTASRKGKFYISWGGNRDYYTKSDITFKGNGYNFTLQDVKAKDKPKGWHIDYINPMRMTIPQTNFNLRYFITDKYSVSLSLDHMKYVMRQNQNVVINGTIDLPASEYGSRFNGSYNGEKITLTEDFLTFEHTDGLNYIFTEFARTEDLSPLFKINNTDKIQININAGLGAGVLYPKTNATIFSRERHDAFHVAGFGVSASAGLNFTFFKHFFIETTMRTGYINMSDIRTTHSAIDKASQDFFYLQNSIMFGGIFRLF